MRENILRLLFFCLLISCAVGTVVRYDNWKVIRANIKTEEEREAVLGWDLDVWTRGGTLIVGDNDIRVSNEHIKAFEELSIQFEVIVNDLQQLIDEVDNRTATTTHKRAEDDAYWTSYHNAMDIDSHMYSFQYDYGAGYMRNILIGHTAEGYELHAYIVSGSNYGPKKRLFFSGNQHAREWISGHALLCYITHLVLEYRNSPNYLNVPRLANFEYHFVPMMNPEGYQYSKNTNRMWRKNRAYRLGKYGVDLNRNWDDHWCLYGGSTDPNSDVYCGQVAFSEYETKAVRDYLLNNIAQSGPWDGFIDFHSYSQSILRQYGYSNAVPPDGALQQQVGDRMASECYTRTGVQYSSTPSWTLYYTGGTIDDWFYARTGTKLTYCIELPPVYSSSVGFLLGPENIIPVSNQIASFVQTLADALTPPPTPPPTPKPTPRPNLNIYVNSMLNSWQDWSWSTSYTLVYTGLYHSSTASIKFTPKNYEGIKLRGVLNTNLYKGVQFWIHGGTAGHQIINFDIWRDVNGGTAVSGGTVYVGASISGGFIPPNVWTMVYIPFNVALGTYDGIWFQDDNGAAQGVLYIDDITLVGR